MTRKPVVAVTMGDPAGIGPEIIVRALEGRKVRSLCRPVVVGRSETLSRAAALLGSSLRFHVTSRVAEPAPAGAVALVEAGSPRVRFRQGRPTAPGGRLSLAAIEKAVDLALTGSVDAVVTAPVSKEAIRKAGSPFPGHTEMLASLTGTKKFAMMLVGGPLRVSLATIHIPLREVPGALTAAGIGEVIDLTRKILPDFDAADGKIAVCGLNPHAGEAGIMGEEDRRIVAPAVRAAARRKINVSGPHPADTVFFRAARGEFAAVVAMYHDQGLIPIKTLAFDTGVNLTLGLPIIRTSVDHGTAYDLAGKGVAKPDSLVSAIRTAAELARNRMTGS
jgi:4-hydroxythreonine-4-phosphate dehydrogenase